MDPQEVAAVEEPWTPASARPGRPTLEMVAAAVSRGTASRTCGTPRDLPATTLDSLPVASMARVRREAPLT